MITTAQFGRFEELYGYYNAELFGGELADCLLNMSRCKGSYGFFKAAAWKKAGAGGETSHEISLNPDHLARPETEWHSTLVHEMCHLWQRNHGKPSRAAYHNREWADKMVEVGLIPSATGAPGGKRTGQRMHHYAAPGGRFELAFRKLKEAGLRYEAVPPPPKERTAADKKAAASKAKYACPCGNNVWGRPGLRLICASCMNKFTEEAKR